MNVYHGFKTQKSARQFADIVKRRYSRTVRLVFNEADRIKHLAEFEGLKLPAVVVYPTDSDLIPDPSQQWKSGMIGRFVKVDPIEVHANIAELAKSFYGKEVAK